MSMKQPSKKPHASKPKATNQVQSQEQPLSLQEKFARASQDVAKWSGLAQNSALSPRAALVARNMEQSSRAELSLREKALQYAEPNSDPEVEKNLNLYRLLRLPLPISTQAGAASTSAKTETSEPKT